MSNDQDDDMYLFQGDMGQTPNAFTGQTFDTFLDATNGGQEDDDDDMMGADFLEASDTAVRKEYTANARIEPVFTRASTSSASSNSSSDSPPHHNRNISTATTTSPTVSKNEIWDTGISGMSMPIGDQYYEAGMDQDLEQQMASAFDFETAASTPSGYDAATVQVARPLVPNPQMRRNMNVMNMNSARNNSPRMTTAAPASFFLGSREASPLNSMLPTSQAPSPWTKPSPSSGLEETFHHMGMNGDSPGNATFSPNMHINYGDGQFHFAPESTGTPSSFTKDISSPPSTVNSIDGQPTLHIYPTSLKSRVETQIPIRMTLYPMPHGIKKLRLPTHTVSKPKFLAKPETDRSPDTFELYVSLVCTSAMHDTHRKQRALARARGEDVPPYSRPSPASSTGSSSSKDDEEKPLDGGEVKICSGCIQRERKRASRKKQKKPEEEELFQKDEERRVVVFNTNEVKEWIEPTRDNQNLPDQGPLPAPGTMQVELPMRIACYCRHQNEKLGFQVIFTVKDYRDRVIAQAMTNSIMITDDHKTHNTPQHMSTNQPSSMPPTGHLPGAGVFSTGGMDTPLSEHPASKMFKQSYSTPDLTRLPQGFNGQFGGPNNSPFAIPQAQPMSGNTSATLTPRNLSRPASPSGPSGPASKRRKPSGSGKLPTGLTMTRIDTLHSQQSGSVTMPNTAASSPYAPNMPTFMAGNDRQIQPAMHPRVFGNSPPTPGGDGTFNNAINRSFSLENLPRQALMSAPSSRQPSRPGSPLAHHNSFGQSDATFPQAVNSQLMNQSSRRPQPVIHKLVPAEGSTSGGTEVTLLGNGFYQGLEVMFGDTEATTTTFWGEKCLNCIAPPAVQAGMVAVVFKHEHPHYSTLQSTSHVKHSVFTYVDDREIEMLRLALRTIGKQMGTDDPYTAAQQLLQQNQINNNGGFSQQNPYGMTNGHQRHASGLTSQAFAPQELERCLLSMLHLAKQQIGSSPVQLGLRRPSGLALLHLAASLDMSMFTLALLRAGADPNMLDSNGFTPMHHAAMHGHESVIDQLRLGGADHRLRSTRNFIPADVATTLQAYQATMRPVSHSRSHSAVLSTLGALSRNQSSQSMGSFWESSSSHHSESESELADDFTHSRAMPYAQPLLRSVQPSRRASCQDLPASQTLIRTMQNQIQPDSPSTLVNAWRQLVNMTQAQQTQLAEQLQYLQETIPNLTNIQLPDYQNNGMMRRMSALFPNRLTTPAIDDTKEAISPAASSAPPSYDELFPATPATFGEEKKDTAALQAAAEAVVDQHYEREDQSSSRLVQQLERTSLQSQPPKNVDRIGLMQDHKLFFFWIPLLVALLVLMISGTTPFTIVVSVSQRLLPPRLVETPVA